MIFFYSIIWSWVSFEMKIYLHGKMHSSSRSREMHLWLFCLFLFNYLVLCINIPFSWLISHTYSPCITISNCSPPVWYGSAFSIILKMYRPHLKSWFRVIRYGHKFKGDNPAQIVNLLFELLLFAVDKYWITDTILLYPLKTVYWQIV